MKKLIGGEFWYTPNILSLKKTVSLDHTFLLQGGLDTIRFILDTLHLENHDIVLLPSYLCPTILIPFREHKVQYDFYAVDENLTINLEQLKNRINQRVKALYIIDYFGFYHNAETLRFLRQLRQQGMIIIEDAVQCFWMRAQYNFIGNYVFNSFRKFLPLDASIVLSNVKNTEMAPKCEPKYEISHDEGYSRKINQARVLKSLYVYLGMGSEAKYLAKFDEAHKAYYMKQGIGKVNGITRKLLEHIKYEELAGIRKENYKYLYGLLKGLKQVELMFHDDLGDVIPLALVLKTDARDKLREHLRHASIFTAIHWDITRIQGMENQLKESMQLSSKILSIPIDHRYRVQEMERVADTIKGFFQK